MAKPQKLPFESIVTKWITYNMQLLKQCEACDNICFEEENVCPFCNNYQFSTDTNLLSAAAVKYLNTFKYNKDELPEIL